jgi:hypothetical protein
MGQRILVREDGNGGFRRQFQGRRVDCRETTSVCFDFERKKAPDLTIKRFALAQIIVELYFVFSVNLIIQFPCFHAAQMRLLRQDVLYRLSHACLYDFSVCE